MALKSFIILYTIILNGAENVDSSEDWSKFINGIEEAISSYSSYILPTNNNEYHIDDVPQGMTDFGTYDFIIVGGGTAGGVLANRLTEEPFSVLVLEAGKEGPSWAAVLGISPLFYRSEWVWGYNSTPQTTSCLGSRNHQCFYPRGKALGGSSVVNGGLYVRGHPKDYDRWEEAGNPGWSYKECLPYFKKSENAKFTHKIDRASHGSNGPQTIDIPEDTPELTSNLLDAFGSIGKPEIDYNGPSLNGAGRMQYYLDYNTRSSSAHAFFKPIKHRQNLRISLESFVTKIRIFQRPLKAYGVEFIKNGQRYFATARTEVILSAGAINSPQILMLSGIGPKGELQQHNINVVADLPVGKGLLDHVNFPCVFYRTNTSFYNVTLMEGMNLWREAKRPLVEGIGAQIIGFFNFEGSEESQPEIEIYVNRATPSLPQYFNMNDDIIESYKHFNSYTDILVNVVLLHPRSVGSVRLQSSNPRNYPLIHTNYLSDLDNNDIENMYKGIQAILKLNETKAFQNFHGKLMVPAIPGCDDKFERMSREWWYCALRTVAHTLFHPVGTTRMGSSPSTSVVNADLRVHGIGKLRVVDAGVIPSHISGHTNAAVVMLAEKIADVIKTQLH
ncbi:glucose dehydrogenase [FAD, quinone]-like [Anthonomus grandis grandis]|uniref:glucose dehydrogenase [FAD, quinone]-like n=1 Tax=Anthonomus grandis grandis TaxID=2921223 RepID=UPI0021654265|nr:glucose dehydrogenase [FAD, quinone]-like [Anthonomus grandis grandis]